MEESIKNFYKQFSFEPELHNGQEIIKDYKKFVIGGMGGSHLGGGIIKNLLPSKEMLIHRDYGIPELNSFENVLFIASSYSGNTEEVLDFADEAYSKGLDLVVVTTGGKLLDFAQKNNIPYILMPNTNIQPRTALGYFVLSFMKIIDPVSLQNFADLSQSIKDETDNIIIESKNISKNLENKIPVIYSSVQNEFLSYIWKIKFNETAKIPSFYNLFPELNHNEMQGYDFVQGNKELSKNFYFIFIKDSSDDSRIQKRMEILEKLYQEKGFEVLIFDLYGKNKIEKIFFAILLADFISIKLAHFYKVEPEKVPLIESFKICLKK